MQLKNMALFLLKSLYRNKSKSLIYLGLMGFCIFFLSVAYSLAFAYYFSIDSNLNTVPEYRSFILEINNQEVNLSLEEWVNKLKQYENISEAYEYIGPLNAHLEGFESSVLLDSGDSLYIPKTMIGRGFMDVEQEEVTILPSKLILHEANGYKEIETKDYIDKKLTIRYPTIDSIQTYLELKVIGVYEVIEGSKENKLFIPLSDYHNLIKSQNNSTGDKESGVNEFYSLIVVVDDYRNFDTTVKALNTNREFNVILSEDNILDTNLIAAIKAISLIMFLIIIIITFFTIRVVIDASIHDRSREIALFKAIGYNNRHIFCMIFTEAIILSGISCMIALIFSKITITYIINPYLSSRISDNLIDIYLRTSIAEGIVVFILIILLSLLSSLNILRKTNKISPTRLMGEAN